MIYVILRWAKGEGDFSDNHKLPIPVSTTAVCPLMKPLVISTPNTYNNYHTLKLTQLKVARALNTIGSRCFNHFRRVQCDLQLSKCSAVIDILCTVRCL